MALHGLGKIYARLAERSDDDVQFTRSAMTMYSRGARDLPDNHLAANELGVLLCRTATRPRRRELFERAIDIAPSATAYHNLAVAQQKLGIHGQAAANEQESQRLAAWERSTGAVSRRAGVAMGDAGRDGPRRPARTIDAARACAEPQSLRQSTIDTAQVAAGAQVAKRVSRRVRSVSMSNTPTNSRRWLAAMAICVALGGVCELVDIATSQFRRDA